MIRRYGILLHGGARSKEIRKTSERAKKISKYIRLASQEGFSLLKRRNNAIDAVEVAVAMMEDSRVFNAGAGSCLTIDGRIEMDASIMSGRDLSAGSVGMVRDVSNPIKLARHVMEKSDNVLLVSTGAIAFAKLVNMPLKEYHPDEETVNKYKKLKKKFKKLWNKDENMLHKDINQYCTVGAVALDIDGGVASAVSTGGRWLKTSGRIGDSAIIGAGIYADNRLGAACATGNGEYIMRLCLSKYVCDRMATKKASNCSIEAIKELSRRFGSNTGGIIAIDKSGGFGIAHNTPSMPISFISSKNDKSTTFFCVP